MQGVNKVKYIIEAECEVTGDIDKIRDVSVAATEGAEVNITDIDGVVVTSVKCVKAVQTIEQELDLEPTLQI